MSDFHDALVDGLTRRPRRIPCRFLYDAAGSALFERITQLDEYYLTRAETALLQRHGADIAALVGGGARVVEFGAGSMRKTRLLLSALERPSVYLPIDVAETVLLAEARRIRRDHPGMAVVPMVADFTRPMILPPGGGGPALGFFPGSTIGNMKPKDAAAFLQRSASLLGPGGWLLVGVDMPKDPRILHAAYDDSHGVTAAFTRNLLVRANRELGADFDLSGFRHRAWWNAGESRMEIHLVAEGRHRVRVDGRDFALRHGEAIHVEDCYKFDLEKFSDLAQAGGFTSNASWTDTASWFSLHLLRVA